MRGERRLVVLDRVGELASDLVQIAQLVFHVRRPRVAAEVGPVAFELGPRGLGVTQQPVAQRQVVARRRAHLEVVLSSSARVKAIPACMESRLEVQQSEPEVDGGLSSLAGKKATNCW